MTTTKPRNETAAERYAARLIEVAKLITMLQESIAAHNKAAAADPKDWGAAGDLDLVRSNLLDTVAFISGSEREDVESLLAKEDIKLDVRELRRLARALNTRADVYHLKLGRIIDGEWGIAEGRLIVRAAGATHTIDPNDLHDGNMRPFVI